MTTSYRSIAATLSATAIWLATPSQAAFKGCYQRNYTDAELSVSVGQRVDAVQVQLGQSGSDEGDEDMLAVKLMTGDSLFFSRLDCKPATEGLTCSTDLAEGKLRIDSRPKGMRVTLLTDLQVAQEGMGDDIRLHLEKGPANGVFALLKVSEGNCTKEDLGGN